MSVFHIHPEVLAFPMKFKAKQAPDSLMALTFALLMGASAGFCRKKVTASDLNEVKVFGKWCFTVWL